MQKMYAIMASIPNVDDCYYTEHVAIETVYRFYISNVPMVIY